MALPVFSVRAAPEHAGTIRRVAAALREEPGSTARIEAAIGGASPAELGTRGQHNYGLFGSEAAALAVLRDRLVAALDPEAIWLFGSRGRGRGRAESDFDLLVVLPDARGLAGLDHDRAYAPVAGLGIGVDVVPCLAADFAAEKDRPGTLAFEAARGRSLYLKRRHGRLAARR